VFILMDIAQRRVSPWRPAEFRTGDLLYIVTAGWRANTAGLLFRDRVPSLTWIVILSVYGADTIAINLSLSALISWYMKSIIGFLNNYNLHAITSTLLKVNYIESKKVILLS
jgi:hypothetical protein